MSADEQQLTRDDFNELFEKNELALRLYARALLPDWDSVDDIMQTASLVMWRKIEQVDAAEGFLPWGKVIVRFESQKFYRNRQRDPLLFTPELLDVLAEHEATIPKHNLEDEEAAMMVCLDALSPMNRELVLAPYRGHGYLTDLAKSANRSRNSLYKQIRRIRKKLESCAREQLRKLSE